VNSPPTALTTLAGIRALEDPSRYAGGPGDAYISVVRVRVGGAERPGPVAEARLSRVAAAIREATGLQVDIVKGASPRPLQVHLPAGRFGRPALTVTEPWSVKGVAFVFSRAVSAQDLALFVLVLVGASVLVGQTSYTSIRRRRAEFGVLRALGWPSWRVTALVEAEMLLLALVAGAAAVAAGIPLARVLGLGVTAPQLVLAVPLALGVAALATLPPALSAARGSVVEVVRGGGRLRRSRPLLGAVELGLRDLVRQWRAEALVGVAVVALGAALVGAVQLITGAFHGQLDTTVLGAYLAGRVRPFHLVIAALTLLVGAIAVAEIVTLSCLERRRQLGALRALGWPRTQVALMVGAQAVAMGLAGGVVGSLVTLGVAGLLGAAGPAVAASIGWSLGSSMLATLVAAAGPLVYAYRADPAEALRS
jgi:hypothetical protein